MRRMLIIGPLLAAISLFQQASAQQAGASTPAAGAKPPMSAAEIDQVVAPIALYPDSLVSQILMASTYPLEVVQAERWVKANAGLKGDALAKALNEQEWDASVKSLTGFPDVLTMMSEKLDWTTKLGDAFISQQKDVLAAVQNLRAKARSQGNLQSTPQQVVEVKQSGGAEVIVIESASPQVVYVPQYDPVVVYGAWPYPAYPPYTYYPPAYVPGTGLIAFGTGLALGAAWGWAWGNCNWNGGDIDIDVNRNTNFNTTINRTEIRNELNAKGLGDGQGRWQHDGSHRRGAEYRDAATASQYGRGSDARAAQARDQYRGRAEAGQRDMARGGSSDRPAAGMNGGPRGGDRPSAGTMDAARAGGGGNRPSADSRDFGAGASSRSGGSAFEGSRSSGSSTRAASSRGSASRSSASSGARSGGGGGGGGGRSGGGGGRGGGGRGR